MVACREVLPAAPPIEVLELLNCAFVTGGGAIDALPLMLALDFALESDVRFVVAGVPVLGVDVAELAGEYVVFVGDFTGDLVDNRDPTADSADIRLCLFLAISGVIPLDGLGRVATPFTGFATLARAVCAVGGGGCLRILATASLRMKMP